MQAATRYIKKPQDSETLNNDADLIAIKEAQKLVRKRAENKKGGRGKKKFLSDDDKATLRKLLVLHPTKRQLAAFFEMSFDTWLRICNEDPEINEIIEEGLENTKMSLMSWQIVAAKNGSVPMMIWLGKQYLGQTDKQEVFQENKNTHAFTPEDVKRIANSIINNDETFNI